jgi:RimJ/RimL family protein N-acetyltransferase
MGYWVRASRERRGIGSAAARLASRFAFTELGLARIEIVALPDNVASRRVAEKIGARLECVARNRLQFRGEPRDAAVYSLVPGDLSR